MLETLHKRRCLTHKCMRSILFSSSFVCSSRVWFPPNLLPLELPNQPQLRAMESLPSTHARALRRLREREHLKEVWDSFCNIVKINHSNNSKVLQREPGRSHINAHVWIAYVDTVGKIRQAKAMWIEHVKWPNLPTKQLHCHLKITPNNAICMKLQAAKGSCVLS